jgi:hypothetical protein
MRMKAMTRRFDSAPSTARFFLADEERWLSALLDYIMISPDLMARGRHGASGIRSTIPVCYKTPELREALLMASDHFPVTLDIEL